jgi:hypothetical protein
LHVVERMVFLCKLGFSTAHLLWAKGSQSKYSQIDAELTFHFVLGVGLKKSLRRAVTGERLIPSISLSQ